MCKGDAHILEEGLTMPMLMNLANSAFVLASFSGERWRALADPGCPVVMMQRVTPWHDGVSLVHGVVREGNSLKSWVYGSLLVSGVSKVEGMMSNAQR